MPVAPQESNLGTGMSSMNKFLTFLEAINAGIPVTLGDYDFVISIDDEIAIRTADDRALVLDWPVNDMIRFVNRHLSDESFIGLQASIRKNGA
jgi:hypothetical protein